MTEEYDLAFSFAGEDRAYVEKVKVECEKVGLSIYYDLDRRIDQWGKSFIGEQRKVYSGYKTKHFVPFISRHYFAKPIPTDEFKAALMESTKRSQYILPIKLDDSEVSTEYLHRDTQYLHKKDYPPEQLAGALKLIVSRSSEPAKNVDQLLTDELDLPAPKITPRTYSKLREAEALIAYVAQNFEKHLSQLEDEGYVPVVRKKDESLRVVVEREGKTVFTLNLFFSSIGGDNTLGFNFNQHSIMANTESVNGTIEPRFNEEQQAAGYRLMDFSNFGERGFYSKQGIMEFLWKRMTEQLEAAHRRH